MLKNNINIFKNTSQIGKVMNSEEVKESKKDIVGKPKARNNLQDKLAAINAIKQKFTSTIIKMYVNSLGREVNFREITVSEQKKLSRIMIDNENRKDIVYDAQCAILKQICLEEDFDVYSLTEFDKIKLLLMLYQRNMSKHDIAFICPECKFENKYEIDFSGALKRLDEFEVKDQVFNYENPNWKFTFTLAYPKVSKVSQFYSSRYLKMVKSNDKRMMQSVNNSINVDYVDLFIKEIEFEDKASGEKTAIDVSDYTIDELLDIISVFPQDVMYSENGIIQYITSEFITKVNNVFERHKCAMCGKECDSLQDGGIDGFL